MIPSNVMLYIAGVFPLLSFVVAFIIYYYFKRTWVATVVVLGGTLAALLIWFTMKFWSWLLMYLFICWLGCWAAYHAGKWRESRLH